jgi:tetratricopeptide (TPR) repeat protein
MIECLRQLGSNFRAQNRRWELANTLIFIVAILISTNQIEPASIREEVQPHALDALAIFQEMGDYCLMGSAQRYWGWLLFLQEKFPEALKQLEAAQSNLEKAGDSSSAAYMIYYMIRNYEYLGDFDSMFQYQHIFRQRMEEIGDKAGAAAALSDESIVALRYSTLEHACLTRQESLSLYLEVGHAHGAAWATWEMGEIKRVAGDLARAQEWFEKARLLFEVIEDRTSSVFYQRGLGDIAQMTGDYRAAKEHFQESARQAQAVEHSWGLIYALCGLGRAEIALNKAVEAREHYSQALQLARRFYYPEMALVSMTGFASLFALRGDAEQAVELGTLVLNQKLSWNETRSQMVALLDSITTLSPEVFDAAQERGRNLDLKEAIRHLLS